MSDVAPSLRIEGLHIEGLRAIRRLDWPGDGPGWGGTVPEMVLVGGANGSGKTTLLDFLAGAWRTLEDRRVSGFKSDLAPAPWWSGEPGASAWVDFALRSNETGLVRLRFLCGDERFVEQNAAEASYGISFSGDTFQSFGFGSEIVGKVRGWIWEGRFPETSMPSLLYIPSRARSLVVPTARMKTAGKRLREPRFLHRWEPPSDWDASLEALLYSARWEDLNAKEEGRPGDARHFESFARAYETFFGPEKRLTWHKGELFVEVVATGALHDLSGLSSGEQQVLVLVSELLDRWRPGSLVLIDEPELHLHVAWQLTFWDALTRWRGERGGQVIAATQSSELFGYSKPGTNVILGGRAP